jgi:hypothetical protein
MHERAQGDYRTQAIDGVDVGHPLLLMLGTSNIAETSRLGVAEVAC